MGRERQKAKARSSVSTVKAKNSGRTKAGRRKVDFIGNKAIAENWDRNQTVTQNYKRLGLSSRLNAATGGVEKFKPGKENNGVGVIAVQRQPREAKIRVEEVRVERDEKGNITRVIRPESSATEQRPNPLNDPLNEVEDEDEEEPEKTQGARDKSNVIAALEQEAAEEAERLAKRRPRQQSKREEEWLGRLVARYGEDTRAMARDRKLNPMQQTQADIQKRLQKWLAGKG